MIQAYECKHQKIIRCVLKEDNIKEVTNVLKQHANNMIDDISIYNLENALDGEAYISIIPNTPVALEKKLLADGMSAVIIIDGAADDEFPFIYIPASYVSIFERFYQKV